MYHRMHYPEPESAQTNAPDAQLASQLVFSSGLISGGVWNSARDA